MAEMCKAISKVGGFLCQENLRMAHTHLCESLGVWIERKIFYYLQTGLIQNINVTVLICFTGERSFWASMWINLISPLVSGLLFYYVAITWMEEPGTSNQVFYWLNQWVKEIVPRFLIMFSGTVIVNAWLVPPWTISVFILPPWWTVPVHTDCFHLQVLVDLFSSARSSFQHHRTGLILVWPITPMRMEVAAPLGDNFAM